MSIVCMMKKNSNFLIVVIVILILLYLTFYTNYIIDNKDFNEMNNDIIVNNDNEINNDIIVNNDNEVNNDVIMNNEQGNKKVHFDTNQNQEIIYELDSGNPEREVRISQCTYPMINKKQININDCALDGTCLNPLPDQNWFRDQRMVKKDLPGYSGYNLANFSFDENIKNDRMMQNMIYDDSQDENENENEHFSPIENKIQYQYQNAPFSGSPVLRGSLPSDLCRSCVVGTCTSDVCTSETGGQQFMDYNYH